MIRKSDSLSIEEQERLYNAVDSFEDLILFKLALTTGIRREDIVAIELSGVDLTNRKITFWEHKKRHVHTVPIAESIMPDLQRYVNSLPKGSKRLFGFTGRTAYNKLQAVLKRAGISKQLAFHDLRRTFVKTAKRKGLDIKTVAQITDDRVSTVEEYYSNLDMEELKEEVNKL